jgi:serine/threonine protein kinase
LGRYRIQRTLGSGGMGTVYRAWDPQLERAIAIKVVNPELTDEPMRIRLVKEAQALAKLSHPHVCHVYDVGTEGTTVWVAMELIDGQSLRPWSDSHSAPELLRVLRDAAEGLHAAHAANIIHRDVKPENVLVGSDGRAVVTDFGLARTETVDAIGPTISGDIALRSTASSVANATQSGIVAGTPAYLAPEQLTGAPLDARVDQFAWGVMAWELITGVRPFPIVASERLVAIRNGITAPPSMSAALASVLVRAMSAAPRDRFMSMRLLLDAFAQATIGPVSQPSMPHASSPPGSRAAPTDDSSVATNQQAIAPKRSVSSLALAGFAVLAALMVLGFAALWMRDRKYSAAQLPAPSKQVAAAPAHSSAAELISQAIGSNVPVADPVGATPPTTIPPTTVAIPKTTKTPGVTPPSTEPAIVATPTMPTPVTSQPTDDPKDYKTWGIPPPNRKISENKFAELCQIYADPKTATSKTGLGNDLDWGPVVRRQVVHGLEFGKDASALLVEVKGQRRNYQFDGSNDFPGTGLLDVPVGTMVAVCPEQETKSFVADDRSWDTVVLMSSYLAIAKAPAIAAFTKDAPYHVRSTKLHYAQIHDEVDDDLKGAVLVRTRLISVEGHRWMTDDTWAADIPENLPSADQLKANTTVWLVLKDVHTTKYTGTDKDHDDLLLVGTAKAVITNMFPAP